MVMDVDAVQPLASVTVKLYVPASWVKLPVPVKGVVPPEALTVTVVLPPLQAIVPDVDDATSSEGCVMVMDVDAVQPLASVTVKLWVPAVWVKLPVPL